MQHSLVEDHSDFGWIVFLLVVAPMVLLGRRLEDAEGPSPLPTKPPALDSRAVAIPAVALGVLATLVVVGYFLEPRATPVAAIQPPVVNGWQHTSAWLGPGRPRFLGAGAEIAVSYSAIAAPRERVDAYIASYSAQRQGAEIVHGENHPQGDGVAAVERGEVTIEEAAGTPYTFMELEVSATNPQRLVWYGARVAGRAVAEPVRAKLYQVVGALTRRQDAQVVVLSARCEATCDKARIVLTHYATQATSSLFNAAEDAALAGRDSR